MVVFIYPLSLLYGIEVDSRGTTNTTKKTGLFQRFKNAAIASESACMDPFGLYQLFYRSFFSSNVA